MLSLTPLGNLTRFRRSNVKNEAYLITEDVSIKVHGIILAARNAKIEVMLEESENIPAVEFSDDLTGLEDCVDLVYGGSVEIREDNFKTIYKFGKLFQIREMMESVLSWIAISVTYDKFWSVYLQLRNLHDDNSVFVDIIKGYLRVDGDNFVEPIRELCRSQDSNTITAVVELLSRIDDVKVLSIMENLIDAATKNNETPAATTASSTGNDNYFQTVVSSSVSYIENAIKSDSFDECNKSRCKQVLQKAARVCTNMETFRTITEILFDTCIHTVINIDTSSQPSTSSTFTSPSISKETSQPLPDSCTKNALPHFGRPSTYGSFTVKDLNLERVKQLTSPTTSYGDLKYFTENAGTGIHPCLVVEIVLKWWSVRTDREHVDMSFITPLITTIQNVSSMWYCSVCYDERYKGLTKTLDIPKPTAGRSIYYRARILEEIYGLDKSEPQLEDFWCPNTRVLMGCISKGDGTPAQLEDLRCTDNMERYRQCVPAFTYNTAVFPPYGDTKHHWYIITVDPVRHVSLITDSKEKILDYINNINISDIFLAFIPLPDTLQ